MKKKIAVQTFGCEINQYETACIIDDFIAAGYEKVSFNQVADVYLINSCTVTNRTDYKSRNALRKALEVKKNNPNTTVVITGCYSQINKDDIEALGDVDLIVDNNSKDNIVELVAGKENSFNDIFQYPDFSELSTETMLDRSRAFLKVQDGCNFFCAYCTVPYGRGKPRSRDPQNVVKQVQSLVNKGFKEFVIGGINLGLYGIDFDEDIDLAHLLTMIDNTQGVEIVRLSSIEPQLFTPSLLAYIKHSDKIAPHFHIPLQSGSDALLKSMGRHYNTDEFRATVEKLRDLKPSAAFGFDVIVGLPGETDQLFKETYDFLKSMDMTYLHAFSYSRRPGTPAYDMKNQVKGDVIKERVKLLTQLSSEKSKAYANHLLSNKIELQGVIEKSVDDYWTALSDHYIRLYCKSNHVDMKEVYYFNPVNKIFEGLEVELIDRG